ncbi:hypothetical protein [Rhizobium sp. NFR12]|uniref:hypothetical protein n=1 Tax=Rhizobium sp. NFR12 TaxID=1566261 RepID=UPI0008A72676|nr:hypothetical protein [Rhizobium sp. NFR12]SEH24155.1 hypothetical protein SAMN03159407_2069 [Rhizobium sp. NFR12]
MDHAVALFKLKAFIAVGHTARVLRLIDEQNASLMHADTKEEFTSLLATVDKMKAFEKRYGAGSCITIDDPITAARACARPELYDPVEIANARAAPASERASILAAVPKF